MDKESPRPIRTDGCHHGGRVKTAMSVTPMKNDNKKSFLQFHRRQRKMVLKINLKALCCILKQYIGETE